MSVADDIQRLWSLIRQLQGAYASYSAPNVYSPTWTGSGGNPVIGNGSIGGRYFVIGGMVFVTINVVAGSTTTFGSGTYNLTLPVAPITGSRWGLSATITDAGAQHYTGAAIINGASTFESIVVGSNATGPTDWTSTAPFTFGNTDRVVITGAYAIL